MIICKYKDGSSIRVYDSDIKRLKAIKAFQRMGGLEVQRLASCPNHYSLKIMSINGMLFAEYNKARIKSYLTPWVLYPQRMFQIRVRSWANWFKRS